MHKRHTVRQGFTIVELLIVIVVIAILAAISIVAFTGVQNRGYNSVVAQDLANAAKKLELTKADLGHYPRYTTNMPTGFKFSKSAYLESAYNALYCINHDSDEYALGAISKSGAGFMLTRSGVRDNATVTASTVCGEVGTTWGGSPPESRSTIHGYFPGGGSPTYTDGWHNNWSWTTN